MYTTQVFDFIMLLGAESVPKRQKKRKKLQQQQHHQHQQQQQQRQQVQEQSANRLPDVLTRDTPNKQACFRRTAALVQNKALPAAKEILLGATRAPPTKGTARKIDDLVATPASDAEIQAQIEEIRAIQSQSLPIRLPPSACSPQPSPGAQLGRLPRAEWRTEQSHYGFC